MNGNKAEIGINFAEMAKFGPLVEATAKAIAGLNPNKLDDDAKAVNKGSQETVAASVRKYAEASKAAGIPADKAGSLLRLGLMMEGLPDGTALNYGRAATGFRTLLDSGKDIAKASVRDAQQVMRSDDQKAKDSLREGLKPLLRDATLAQLQAISDHAATLNIVVKARKVRADSLAGTAEPEAAGEVEKQAAVA